MAGIHHHDDPGERRTRIEIRADERLPLPPYGLRHARKAVTRQVDEARATAEIVEVDRLRATRRLARECEAFAAEEGVDRARLAYVRAPGECDFGRARRRQFRGVPHGGKELCLREYSNRIAPSIRPPDPR